MQICVLLIIALVPLAIAPGLLSDYDITPKIVILLLCESALLVFCKRLVNSLHALYQSTSGRLFLMLLALEWMSTAASTVWSSNPKLSLVGSSWRRDGLIVESAILLFALILACWLAEDARRIRAVLRAVAVTGAIASLYGISQYFGWDPLLPSNAYQAGEGIFTIVRPPGTFGHADYFANWLVMAAFLSLGLWDDDWKIFARITPALATLAIILSGTRSALLGLAAGAVVFVIIARPRMDRKSILILTALAGCFALLYISPAGAKLRARVHWSLDDVRGGARLLLWRDSLQMAVHRPLLGYGPETFTAQFPQFESVELSRAYPDFYQESPHNVFLDALVSRGIPGAIILLGICASALYWARKNAALAAALTGAIVCQQFAVWIVPTALYFYLVIALVFVEVAQPSEFRAKSWLAAIPLAAAIAIVFVLFSVRLLIADRAMAVAEHRIGAGDVAGAAEAYKTSVKWAFLTGEYDLRYSRAMTLLATTTKVFPTGVAAAQQAYDSAGRATQTPEDCQNAWYNYATIAALRNDSAGVESSLRHSIACAPHWFKPHWTLAQFLELTGRHAEARREASISLDLNGGHDPEVTSTAQRILSRP
jgi:O-antigen ligase